MENGNLKATYDQLETRGVRRKNILDVVVEAEALGVAQASRGRRSYGSRIAPSTYRLTWYGTESGMRGLSCALHRRALKVEDPDQHAIAGK
jgi:hypothetical protein